MPMKNTSVPMPVAMLVPVQFGLGLRRVLVAGDESDAGRVVAMGQRNAGIGRHRSCRGHARDDLEGDAVVDEFLGLLAAAAEDEGVAALEPRHDLALFRLPDDEAIDLVLGQRVAASLLAHVDELGIGPAMLQQPLVGEIIVDHHVGLLDAVQALDRDEAGVAGPGADEVDFARWYELIAQMKNKHE